MSQHSLFLLLGAMVNSGITVFDLLKHDYWSIISACVAVMFFGFYVEKLLENFTTMPKPKKEENIYE